MGRPREFDEATVLDAAMQRFWAQGYESTSVRDLAAEMGITSARLCNAYGNKRTLYRRALEFHAAGSVRDKIRRLESTFAPLAAIHAFFEEVVERSATDPDCRGYLLVDAALEASPDDPQLRAAFAAELVLIESFLRRCAIAGQADESVTRSQAADALAKLLLGLRVLARTRPEREVLQGAAGCALALLKLAP